MPERKRSAARNVSPRTCVTCGETFQPYRDIQVACSRPCRDRQPQKVAAHKAWLSRPDVRERKNSVRRVGVNPARREINIRSAMRRYGITYETYLEMLAAQDGKCALCGFSPPPGGVKAASRLHVDHDHTNGAVRALLCNGCNRGLGYLQDDPGLLRRAADYIDSHRNN